MEPRHIDTNIDPNDSTSTETAQTPALTRRDVLRGASTAPVFIAGGSAVAASL